VTSSGVPMYRFARTKAKLKASSSACKAVLRTTRFPWALTICALLHIGLSLALKTGLRDRDRIP
jgi:hypothetical protein